MKKLQIACFAALTILMSQSPSKADWYYDDVLLVDNFNTTNSGTVQIGSGSSAFPNRGTAQTFYSPSGGRISKIRMKMQRLEVSVANIVFQLHSLEDINNYDYNPIASVNLFRFFVPSNTHGSVEFDFRNVEAFIEHDKEYLFSIVPESPRNYYQFSLTYDDNQYADGHRMTSRDGNNPGFMWQTTGDLHFQVWAAIPEPTSATLMIPALCGLAFVRYRRRFRTGD